MRLEGFFIRNGILLNEVGPIMSLLTFFDQQTDVGSGIYNLSQKNKLFLLVV